MPTLLESDATDSVLREQEPLQGWMMSTYQSTLLGRTEVAEGTMAFQFEKPNDFVFKAGQYIDLSLFGSQPGLRTEMSRKLGRFDLLHCWAANDGRGDTQNAQ